MSEDVKTKEAPEVDATKVIELATASKENAEAARKAVEDLTGKVEQVQSDLEKQEAVAGRKFTEMRQYLETAHGKSGADDWFSTFGKWLSGVWHLNQGNDLPDECKVEGVDFHQKATIGTGTSGTSYLVPDLLMPAIFASKDIYGSIVSRCMKVTVPGGQTMNFNETATDPSAYWRTTQGNSMSEATLTWDQGSVSPVLVGAYVTASNELLAVPGVGYAEKAAQRMVRAIVKKEEAGILQGDDDALGTALDPPSDGILTSTSGCTDVGSIADDTIAAYIDFLALCVAQYEGLMNNGMATLVLSPAKVFSLAAEVVSSTNLAGALTWADPRSGLPGQLFGYEYVAHPSAVISGTPDTPYAILAEFGNVVYANSGRLSVDFNPWGSNFLSNATDIRVMTHTDWAFPQASNICYGDYS